MIGHVDTLYLSSTGEPNRERCPVAGAPPFALRGLEPSYGGVLRMSVPKLKVGLEQWNFTTVGVAEMSPMNWAYYPNLWAWR